MSLWLFDLIFVLDFIFILNSMGKKSFCHFRILSFLSLVLIIKKFNLWIIRNVYWTLKFKYSDFELMKFYHLQWYTFICRIMVMHFCNNIWTNLIIYIICITYSTSLTLIRIAKRTELKFLTRVCSPIV